MEEMKARPAVPLPTLGATNDLGKPWRFEEDGCTVTRTAPWSPPGCHPVGCGLKLYVDQEGKLVKVEGDENQQITQGRLCVRCLTLKDYVYNPSRIVHPLKRDPKHRGQADKWERCTWDEALDIIEENYRRITAEYGYESVVFFVGTGREGGTLGPYGTYMLRSPNMCYTQSGYACYVPRMAAAAYNLGSPYPEIDYAGGLPGRFEDPAFVNPECIMIWGKAPLASNPDGFFGHAVVDMMRRGARLIVVDPRITWLSSRADYHLRVRPGTDAALAMAMLNTIIQEDLYDHDFVEYWCYGFEQLANGWQRCRPRRPGRSAASIPPTSRTPPACTPTPSPRRCNGALRSTRARTACNCPHCAICLMALTANIDVPGGQILGNANSGQNETGFGFEEALGKDLISKMIGLKEYPAYANTILDAHADLTLKAMETGDPYPIKMGFYAGNNLMSCTSMEPKRWHDAMVNTLEFCFTLECFMTPSAQATCDVFLPLATAAEEDGVEFAHYGATPVGTGFMNKAITVGECKTDMETCMLVGKRLNPQLWENYHDVYDFIDDLRLHNNHRFKDVCKEVYVQKDVEYYKYETGHLRKDGMPDSTRRPGAWSCGLPCFPSSATIRCVLPGAGLQPRQHAGTGEGVSLRADHGRARVRLLPFRKPPGAVLPRTVSRPVGGDQPEDRGAAGHNGRPVVRSVEPVRLGQDEGQGHHCRGREHHPWTAWLVVPRRGRVGTEPVRHLPLQHQQSHPNFHFGKLGFGAPCKCMICNVRPLAENYDTDMQMVWEKFKREDQ